MQYLGQPHRIVIFVDHYTTKMIKPFIKSLVRHEFAHCLAEIQTRREKGCDSMDHYSDEWFQACEQLGISPAARTEGNDAGYYRLWCEGCGRERYEFRSPKWDDYLGRKLCCKRDKPYLYEIVVRPLCIADGKAYIVEEDGRETPLPIPATAFS